MKLRKIVWYSSALDDLDAILARLESEGSLMNVVRIADRFEKSVAALRRMPNRGTIVPEFAAQGIVEYRQLQQPPWRILYRVDVDRVMVVAIVDSRRQLDELLIERLVRAQ